MVAPCTHGFPKPSNCWWCMWEGNLEPAPTPVDPGTDRDVFIAKYEGYCNACGCVIDPGDRITEIDGDYRHAACATPGDIAAPEPCPLGCGRPTDDLYGGPCTNCRP